MQNKLNAKLRASFDAADVDRNRVEAVKKLAKQDPSAVSKLIPLAMRRVRTRAREPYGVDIAREGWKE